MEMRSFEVVTTCHATGFESYGRRMLESFEQHWPKHVRLVMYCEGFVPERHGPRVEVRDLLASCPDLVAFKARHADDPRAHGRLRRWKARIVYDHYRRRLRLRGMKWGLGYRWDAVRFAHKSYAIFDAARRSNADVLLWVDADTLFFDDVGDADLERMLPVGKFVGCLKRPIHSECGLVSYDLRNPATRSMLEGFERMYSDDLLFAEDEFHDSFLFDVVRKRIERTGAVSHDIAEGVGGDAEHVLINSWLGRFMDHLKGGRKSAGRSHASDLPDGRSEAYWRKQD